MSTEDSAVALVVLYALGAVGGYGISWIKAHIHLRNPRHQLLLDSLEVPPLVGMLLFGLLAGLTLPSVVQNFDHQWSLYVRTGAQVLVLMRCGLGIRLQELDYESVTLALFPQVTEGIITALLAHWVLNLPWLLSLATGALVASVAPALVVPFCMRLQAHGYGKNKGIQELVIGATACDNLFAIVSNPYTAFAMFASLALSPLSGQNELIAAGITTCGVPLGLIIGLGVGLLGLLHWAVYLLSLISISIAAVLISQIYLTPGFGYLTVLVAAAVSGRSRAPYEQKLVAMVLLTAWKVLEVIIFALAGAALVLDPLASSWLWQAGLVTLLGVIGKAGVAFLISNRQRLTAKERIYCALCRLPKATIQASLAGVFLAAGLSLSHGPYIEYGHQIMTIATVSITLTAPFSSLLVVLAPRLLTCDVALLHSTSLKPMHIPTPLMRMRQAFSQQKQFLT